MEKQEYTFWEFWTKFDIVFPVIQRDYAQGRSSTHATEVRNKLVDALFDALNGNNTLTLDFIYGTEKNSHVKEDKPVFIALDGQQRLTTLFLLHWYILSISGQGFGNQKLKFSYETRESSKKFCEKLIEKASLKMDIDSVGDYIKDQNWFLAVWEEAPTVRGMIKMLDTIHEKVKKNCLKDCLDTRLVDFYKNLTTADKCPIKFHVLSLGEDFSLADDLYVKMNARGLALTPFENFKASLFQLLKDKAEKDSTTDYFVRKIDTEWTNMFWRTANLSNKKVMTGNADSEMMKYIRMILCFNYALEKKGDNFNQDDFNSLLVNAKDRIAIPEEELTFYKLKKELNALTESAIKMLLWAFKSIGCLFDEKGECTDKDNANYCVDIKEKWKLFVQEKKPNYDIQLYIYAIILCHRDTSNTKNKDEWFRLVRNLVENTITDNQDKMREAIRSLKNLYDNHNTDSLSDDKAIKDRYGHFSGQGKEENEKYELINKDSSLKELIYKFENCPYLEGQIKCLLRWSKNSNGKFCKEEFIKLGEKLLKLFEEQEKTKCYIETTLLNMTDTAYPYQFQDLTVPKRLRNTYYNEIEIGEVIHQYSFSNIKESRDYNWRRLLNDDPNDIKEDIRKKSLEACQEQFKQMLLGNEDWNKDGHFCESTLNKEFINYLIRNPSTIEYCSLSIFYVTDKGDACESRRGIGKFFSKRSETKSIKKLKE